MEHFLVAAALAMSSSVLPRCAAPQIGASSTVCHPRSTAPHTRPRWLVDRYKTTRAEKTFIHFVVHHSSHQESGQPARDVWMRFHGSGPADPAKARRTLKATIPWIVESGDAEQVYCFVTTESTAYDGRFQSLCGDDTETGRQQFEGPNFADEQKDWSYASTGVAAVNRHLAHLTAYGYVPSASRLTVVGYRCACMQSPCILHPPCSHPPCLHPPGFLLTPGGRRL